MNTSLSHINSSIELEHPTYKLAQTRIGLYSWSCFANDKSMMICLLGFHLVMLNALDLALLSYIYGLIVPAFFYQTYIPQGQFF
jgi:hypothetical protein